MSQNITDYYESMICQHKTHKRESPSTLLSQIRIKESCQQLIENQIKNQVKILL